MKVIVSVPGQRGYFLDWLRDARTDVDLVGLSCTRMAPALHRCDRWYLMPLIRSDRYQKAVLEVVERERADCLLSLFDEDLVSLSQIAHEIRALGCVPILPSAEIARICFDKWECSLFLTRKGIPYPRSFGSLDEFKRAVVEGEIGFPVVVKPMRGRSSHGVHTAHSLQEVEFHLGDDHHTLVQEHIDGRELNLDILSDLDGNPIEVVVKEKLAMRAGETDQARTIAHEDAQELGYRLGGVIRVPGAVDVDVMEGDRGLAVIDVNPRFGGGYPAAHLAGAQFPRRLLEMIAKPGATPPARLGYLENVCMMKSISIVEGLPETPADRMIVDHETTPS